MENFYQGKFVGFLNGEKSWLVSISDFGFLGYECKLINNKIVFVSPNVVLIEKYRNYYGYWKTETLFKSESEFTQDEWKQYVSEHKSGFFMIDDKPCVREYIADGKVEKITFLTSSKKSVKRKFIKISKTFDKNLKNDFTIM